MKKTEVLLKLQKALSVTYWYESEERAFIATAIRLYIVKLLR